MKLKTLLLYFFILCLNCSAISAQNATITGVVTDGEVNELLTGAFVSLKGAPSGTITDANGHYSLYASPGKHTVVFRFVGFSTKEFPIDVKSNQVLTLNVTLQPETTSLKEVTVSVQAKGQMAAINKQINAEGIINAVSGEKLNELPDANVADAIGRLPGLMIQRDGGEGQKIIIRGLDPKYNTVAINGMNAPSTSDTDRSTDLNMISPDMVAGAEVLKANTADKDADGLGGTVNIMMKDAPNDFRLTVTGETGYHSQINGFGRFKGGLFTSDRFFDRRLGAIFSAAIDRTDRSNDTFSAGYKVNGNLPTPGLDYTKPWSTTVSLQNNKEIRTRYNFNLNLDFKLGNGSKLRMTNLFSRMNRDRDIRQKRYDLEGNRLRFQQREINSHTTNLTNMLQGEFNFYGSTLFAGIGRSHTDNKTPYSHEMQFRMNSPYLVDIDAASYLPPYLVTNSSFSDESDPTQYYLYEAAFEPQKAKETELSGWLDWKKPFHTGGKVFGFVKLGAKYRQKDRSLNTDRMYTRADLKVESQTIFDNMPDITPSGFKSDYIGITDFIDHSFKAHDFMGNKYPNMNFDMSLDRDAMRNFYAVNKDLYHPIYSTKLRRDYEGTEKIWAAYLMTEINIGTLLTFIPGVRYDHSNLKYTAFSGDNVPDSETSDQEVTLTRNTDSEHFGYFLPQIHLKVKPTSWMDIRLAYTHTLSRPDYDVLAPRTIIKPSSNEVVYSRTNLKPALSRNYDVVLSFYPADLGLFTVSGFYKDIKNFIYTRTAYMLANTVTDPSGFGLPDALAGGSITYPLNAPTNAHIKGLEFDLQVQLRRFTRSWWSGITLGANLTLMDSKMDYFETLKGRVFNPDFVAGDPTTGKPFLPTNSFVVYTDRLLKQPSMLFNASVGYDYRKFSGRVSCNYQDGVLIKEQHRRDGADVESTRPFTKWDLALKYAPIKPLSLFLTVSNFTKSSDRQRRNITNYPSRVEYYGTTIYIGFKYDIFK